VKEQASQLWGWIRHHRGWSLIILIVLLAGMGFGTFWTVNLARFGLPPPIGQDCGSIIHREAPPESTTRADANLQPLACFWQAYQNCQAATISQTYMGTDAGYTDTLTIERWGNHCAMYGQHQWQVNTNSGTDTFLCNQLSKAGDSLQVSDCDGLASFTLDPRDIITESYLCGIVGGSHPYRQPRQAELCFYTAYQQCRVGMIKYDAVAANGDEVERDFYIDNHCGIAYWRGIASQPESNLAACASLAMRADGLHFSQCGTDGDVFVPLVPSST